jgi:hypothetical protein
VKVGCSTDYKSVDVGKRKRRLKRKWKRRRRKEGQLKEQ